MDCIWYVQGQHHQWHIRCLFGVWSGTTLRRTSVQLSKPSDATHSVRPVGQPSQGHRLLQPGQLTIRDELTTAHNNNNNKTVFGTRCLIHCTEYVNKIEVTDVTYCFVSCVLCQMIILSVWCWHFSRLSSPSVSSTALSGYVVTIAVLSCLSY